MPDTARVYARIVCPKCGAHLLNSARFVWGAVPSPEYGVGDAVQWLCDQFGNAVSPFELRKVGLQYFQWNFGGAEFSNANVFDEDLYPGNQHLSCLGCGAEIAACMALIRDGIFKDVLALESFEVARILGEASGRANVVVIDDEGRFLPREDWFDHVVPYDKEKAELRPVLARLTS